MFQLHACLIKFKLSCTIYQILFNYYCILTLQYLGPPKITYISPDMTYLEGNKTRLICNATNDADAVNEVQITWFHNNLTSIQPIVPDNIRVIIHNVQNSSSRQLHSTLFLDPINRIDEGIYICKASNHPRSVTESSTKVMIKSKLL